MKKIIQSLIIMSMMFSTSFAQIFTSHDEWNDDDPYYGDYVHNYTHKIQIALILDVSGSMDGLIEQAKSQLWTVVNSIMFDESATGYPQIEIALMEYGNKRDYRSGYMRVLVPFTSNLDWIGDELFSLRTGGNREYGPQAVKLALNNLNWSYSRRDLRLLYIAGNETFHQGYIDYRDVASQARRRDIVVNTIFCGDYYYGRRMGWEDAARLGNGDYLNIEQNYRPHYSDNVYTDRLFSLNVQLNQTYIPYGRRGNECFQRQRNLDRRAGNYGRGYASQRFITKSTGAYLNPDWDLVDAVATGRVKLEDIPTTDLPEEMKRMSLAQRKSFVNNKLNQRKKLQSEMRNVGKKQLNVIKASPVNKGKDGSIRPQSTTSRPQTLDQAIIKSTKHQQAVKSGKGAIGSDQIIKRPPTPRANQPRTPVRTQTNRPEPKNDNIWSTPVKTSRPAPKRPKANTNIPSGKKATTVKTDRRPRTIPAGSSSSTRSSKSMKTNKEMMPKPKNESKTSINSNPMPKRTIEVRKRNQ